MVGIIVVIILFFPKQSGTGFYLENEKRIVCESLYCGCRGLYFELKKAATKNLSIIIRNYKKVCGHINPIMPEKLEELVEEREFEGYCVDVAKVDTIRIGDSIITGKFTS